MVTLFKFAIAILCFFGLPQLSAPAYAAEQSPAPAAAQAYIISPDDGAMVSSPVQVRFGLRGMGIAPAGVDRPDTGHHHLLVDLQELPVLSEPMPATTQLRHFGGGQTEVELDLSPGEHTLQLVLGNYSHVPHEPPVISDQIIITVE